MGEEGYIRVSNFSDSLSICVTSDLNFDGAQDAHWLGLSFDASDKESLFFRGLGVFNPAATVDGQVSVEDYNKGKWTQLWSRFEADFERATADLPMIRRLKEEYNDAAFAPDEVSVLHRECLKVKAETFDTGAFSALDKLIRACDEARKEKSGLYFASD